MKINIFGMNLAELKDALADFKVQGYPVKQIAEWMYQKGCRSFGEMTNLPNNLRAQLDEIFCIEYAELKDRLISADKNTIKFLLEFSDGVAVETVLMRHSYGNSICVSTQAGCNMGCAFCASTLNGLTRNLTAGEILAQVYFVNEYLKPEEQRVNTMVIMGSGEPMANYESVLAFIRLCHEDYCLNMGYRNITLSTSGIVPEIYQLIKEDIPITLSISLHAPNQKLRSELMPINKKYPIDEVVKAGREYGEQTGRRVTYEYILIDGLNDSIECADELADILGHQLANVNLIPINPVVERGFARPSKQRIEAFEQELTKRHIAVTVRREMGRDIQAACGQLRNRHLK